MSFHLIRKIPPQRGILLLNKRLLIAMKLTIFLLTAVCLHATANTAAQNITLSEKNISLEKVLKKIKSQSGYEFFYDRKVFSLAKEPITVKLTKGTLDQAMGLCFKDQANLTYRIIGKVIVIRQKMQTQSFVDTAQIQFSGLVIHITDTTGAPLRGATIKVEGTSIAVQSDDKGNATIANVPDDAKLIITYVGYQTISLRTNGKSDVVVVMRPTVLAQDEVVVIGYGTQKRALTTGAVSRVSGKTLGEVPVVSVEQALQGRVAGVSVTSNGSPGISPIVRIRGISSISFATDPLYVVDGFPTSDLSTIDVKDIESLDVLKDASAAAIYGSRATNGVVMITTKKGKREGKLHVSLDSYFGTQTVTKRLSLLNTEQYKQYSTVYNNGLTPLRLVSPAADQPIYPGATQTYAQTNTDWQDAYFKTGAMTGHNINVNGGNQISRFSASVGYLDQVGTIPTAEYKRYNFRINSEHTISKVFTFGENLYAAYGNLLNDAGENGNTYEMVNVIRMYPQVPVYDPTTTDGYHGVSTIDGGDPTNPIEDAKVKNAGNRTTAKILGTAYLDVNFTKWLKFKSTIGVDYSNSLYYRFSPIYNDGGNINGSSATVATITNNRTLSSSLLATQQLSFDKTFGNHHINAIAVYEQQTQKIRNEQITGNQSSNDLKTLNNASNIIAKTLYGENALLSYLGRLNYEYAGKYLLSAAIRRDGLSVWAPGKKWGTFPSASVGWRIDRENFMQNISAISEMKLRAGYGVTGVNGVLLGNTPWQSVLTSNVTNYPYDNSPTSGAGSGIRSLGNKDLDWEKTKQLNVGLDFGILRNKFTLTLEYYQRKTDNLILSVPLPPSFGYSVSSVNQNVAGMNNNGFEVQLGYNDRIGELTWNASANASFVTNKVTRLAEGVANIESSGGNDFGGFSFTNTVAGQPIQSFYGWQVEGIFQNAAEVTKHATQTALTAPGDIKFKDQNGDGVIDLNDRVFLGSYIPKMTYALNLGANYKNFDLSIFFQGVTGNKVYNATKVISEGMIRLFNASTAVLDAWTPTNTNTNVPRAVNSDPNGNARTSNRFIEDGSYLRLKNIMLGYTIPEASLRSLTKGTVKSFRIYVSAQNILTFTKYSGLDPEVGNQSPLNTLNNGVDLAHYPQPKAVQIGIQANF